MAAIRENKKNGKLVSYRFTTCLERDAQGKHGVTPLGHNSRKNKESGVRKQHKHNIRIVVKNLSQ